MNDDDMLKVGCVRCKKLSFKVWWRFINGLCPKCCNPRNRATIGLNFPTPTINWPLGFLHRMIELTTT
jgi:hypothetical protein